MEIKNVEIKSYEKVYVAADGTEFEDKEECKAYEKSARGVVKARASRLAINKDSECNIFGTGCDENLVWVCVPQTEADIDALRQLYVFYGCKAEAAEKHLPDTLIGKIVFVTFGYGDEDMWVDNLDSILRNIGGKAYELKADVEILKKEEE